MLYKYRELNNFGMRLVSSGELYFSAPGNLNDPLDCTFPSDAVLRAVEGKANKQLRDKLREISSQIYPDKITGESNEFFLAVENRVNNAGIVSLSSTATEPLMWSHYADGHKGICVGIDQGFLQKLIEREDPSDHLIGCPKVSYKAVPDFVDIILSRLQRCLDGKPFKPDRLFGDLVVPVLTTKSDRWVYEEEYRMIRTKPGAMNIPREAIKEVIVGQKIASGDFELVKTLLADPALVHVRMRRADFAENSFSMVITDV